MTGTVLWGFSLLLLQGCERIQDWWNPDLGGIVGAVCESSAECEPGLACAHDGTCATYGEPGTYAPGDSCGHSEECGYGYVCASDWTCAVLGEPGTGGEGDTCATDDDCQIGFDCSSTGVCHDARLPYWEGVSCADDDRDGPFRVYFEVPDLPLANETEFYRLPFPTDIRAPGGVLDLSGHPSPGDVIADDPFGSHRAALEEIGGAAGLNPAVFFRFSREHIVNSVVAFEDAGNSLHYADITAGSPTYGPRSSFSWRTGNSRGRFHCQNWLAVTVYPGFPLTPERTYAVYLTSEIQAEDGDYAHRDDDFDRVMGSERPSDDHLAAAWDAHAPFRAYVADQGLDADEIVAAAVFTTGDPAAALQDLASAVSTADVDPDPKDLTLCDEGVTSPCEGGSDATCGAADETFHEVHGRVSVASLAAGVTGPQVEGADTACFGLTVPVGPAPTGGWPVVVYAPDDTESFRAAVSTGLASALTAAEGESETVAFATLTLDPLSRGEWRDQFDDAELAVTGAWQAAADVLGAERLLDEWSDDGGLTGTPILLSGTDRVFLGRGLGAEAGVLALANSDGFSAAVLASVGGYRSESVLEQLSPTDLRAALERSLGDSTVDRYHPVLNLYQGLWDVADPVCSADRLVADVPDGASPRHLLMIYGLWDEHTPEEAQAALQRALQIPTTGDLRVDFGQAVTVLPTSRNYYSGSDYYTAAALQAEGGMDALLDPDVLRQVSWFLATAVTEDAPTIPR